MISQNTGELSMRRRALIQILIAAVPLRGLRSWAQTATFPGTREAALKQLAATVLPESLPPTGRDALVEQFIRWVREYRVHAEMQAGYGYPRVRYKPESPAPAYLQQLEALGAALGQPGLADRRAAVGAALTAAKVANLPQSPDGKHIASDLMSLYFMSPQANDVAYGARIGKDLCRGLKTSGEEPKPLPRTLKGMN
jgi:hypothetical protein